MSPLLVAVLAIIAVFGAAAVARYLRISLEHRRRPRRSRSRDRDRAS
ncbi:MAG TPA: hypothetical protein PLM61_03940 [Thermoanaerobaculales bacterium]|nr:hypothetical protein [Thermoanaerobaculales bacterium]HQP43936.1 hypothetical protein [Thermoanaerobaculales bacterium]